MTGTTPVCPECASEHTYELGGLQVCSMCDHDIDCKVDGFGAMQLKSSVVEKA